MSLVEAGVRGGAIALLLLIAALLWRDAGRFSAGRYASLFTLGAAADLVAFAPPLDCAHILWLQPIWVLAVGNAAVFWVAASALFDDEFRPSWQHALAWLALVGLGIFGAFTAVPWRYLPHNALAVCCLALALWSVLAGRAGDLDEKRRRLRLTFVISVAIFSSVAITSGGFAGGSGGSSLASWTNSIGNLLLASFFSFTLFSLAPDIFVGPSAQLSGRLSKPRAGDLPDDPRDSKLLEALEQEMELNRAFREENLGIAGLANRLGVPEYRLRQLINQRLGYRNFAAFLNGYRVSEAMMALADPTQAEVPILTIALDAGFSSLGPFNRAFKAKTGQTPSEYRRAQGVETVKQLSHSSGD